MKFTWLNKQGVKSDLGYEVQRTGRFTIEYRDRGKVCSIEIEPGLSDGRPSISVKPTALGQWDDAQPISPDEQRRILRNLIEALEFQGLRVVVEASEEPDWRGVTPLR